MPTSEKDSNNVLVYHLEAKLEELRRLCATWRPDMRQVPAAREMSDNWGPSEEEIRSTRRARAAGSWLEHHDNIVDAMLEFVQEDIQENDDESDWDDETAFDARDEADVSLLDELEDVLIGGYGLGSETDSSDTVVGGGSVAEGGWAATTKPSTTSVEGSPRKRTRTLSSQPTPRSGVQSSPRKRGRTANQPADFSTEDTEESPSTHSGSSTRTIRTQHSTLRHHKDDDDEESVRRMLW